MSWRLLGLHAFKSSPAIIIVVYYKSKKRLIVSSNTFEMYAVYHYLLEFGAAQKISYNKLTKRSILGSVMR
jgi:hypothetical protein